MTDDELIAKYVDPDPHGYGPAEARLYLYGVSVWALIGALPAANGDIAQVAADYELPLEAMEAAVAYYHRHRALIDARLLLNHAA